MRFVFKLEPVLRMRLRDEEDAKRRLGAAVSKEQLENERLHSLEDELSREIDAQTAARAERIWAQGQTLFLEWSQGQKLRIGSQKSACAQAADATRKARQDVVEARRAVQVLEKLKERRHVQWKLDQSRKEQVFASDVAAQRWMRQRQNPEAVGS